MSSALGLQLPCCHSHATESPGVISQKSLHQAAIWQHMLQQAELALRHLMLPVTLWPDACVDSFALIAKQGLPVGSRAARRIG